MSKTRLKQKYRLSHSLNAITTLLVLLVSGCVSTINHTQQQPYKQTSASVTYQVDGEFEDVKENLVMAIENKGAVISYTAHSSEMLNRTAITLNINKTIYQDAEIILFCKAELSHKMVQDDPHNLVLCPYPIAIYTLKNAPDVVYLSIHTSPYGLSSYEPVYRLLVEIINETIEEQ